MKWQKLELQKCNLCILKYPFIDKFVPLYMKPWMMIENDDLDSILLKVGTNKYTLTH